MTAKERLIKEILGKTVIDSEAKNIGKVRDILFDTQSWEILEIHIKLDSSVKKELELGGFSSKTVKTPTKYIKKLGDVVGLSVAVRELVEECEVV